ncbi:MAG TPA: hypothetical protein VLE93_00930 [Candidatus Saccharimonadales bacterium]|nr:hypothetical protein [Candidatus Saccharimonadales bacterium]
MLIGLTFLGGWLFLRLGLKSKNGAAAFTGCLIIFTSQIASLFVVRS